MAEFVSPRSSSHVLAAKANEGEYHADIRVICWGCGGAYHRIHAARGYRKPEYFSPCANVGEQPHGMMFILAEEYGPPSEKYPQAPNMKTFPRDSYVVGPSCRCPACGEPYLPLNGGYIRTAEKLVDGRFRALPIPDAWVRRVLAAKGEQLTNGNNPTKNPDYYHPFKLHIKQK